jgi:hypothetical protein
MPTATPEKLKTLAALKAALETLAADARGQQDGAGENLVDLMAAAQCLGRVLNRAEGKEELQRPSPMLETPPPGPAKRGRKKKQG